MPQHPEVVSLRVRLAKIAISANLDHLIPGYQKHIKCPKHKGKMQLQCLYKSARIEDNGWHELAHQIVRQIIDLRLSMNKKT